MPFSEADTRAKLIDPAIHACGGTEDLIRREETAGAIEIVDGKPRKRTKGHVDYTLRIRKQILRGSRILKREEKRRCPEQHLIWQRLPNWLLINKYIYKSFGLQNHND